MAELVAICVVCHVSRNRGNYDDAGRVFICSGCQADAAQFIAIQDAILDEARQTADAAPGDKQQHRSGTSG